MNPFDVILRLSDDAVPALMASQQLDPAERDFKGFIPPGKGFAEPGGVCSSTDLLLAVYFCRQSRWHKQPQVLESAIAALEFALEKCHDDGSLDLMETNFYDCTMNGFVVQKVAYTYRLLLREARTPREIEARDLIKRFLKISAHALKVGGFHTPNHRWVVASALSLCYKTLADESCRQMAEVYLSEGIDCNEEGDFTERSVGIYDGVNNESLTIIAQELEKPELFEYVNRNLCKNWYYIEPDMTGLTMASRRQDYGKDALMVRHFFTCFQEARRTGDKRLQWLALQLLKQMEERAYRVGAPEEIRATLNHQSLLTRFLLDTSICEPMPQGEPLPAHYDRYFDIAGVARHRGGNWTATLLRGNSTFLKAQNGTLRVYAKIACSFFARGRLIAQQITPIQGGYRLIYRDEWGYVRPIEGLNQPDWSKIDKQARETANMQLLVWQADVTFQEDGITIAVASEGTPEIPMKIELILPTGGMLRSGDMSLPTTAGGWAMLGGDATFQRMGEAIRIQGGFCQHDYTTNMRGSDPNPTDMFSLYMTGFTPVNRVVRIQML